MKNITLNTKFKKINIIKTDEIIPNNYISNVTNEKNETNESIKNINIDLHTLENNVSSVKDISYNLNIFNNLYSMYVTKEDHYNKMNDKMNHKINDKMNDKMNKLKKMKSLLQKKLSSYHQQDKKRKRHTQEYSITFYQLLELLKESNLQCYYCNDNVYIIFKLNRDPKQWTLDRIENHLEHTKDNCVISCLECNLQKRRRNHIRFKESKNIKISFE